MSKAFTRESDDAPDEPVLRPRPSLPPGAKNYLTPAGERRLREELTRLVEMERPVAAAIEDDEERKRQLLTLDAQISRLQESLQSAEVVPPPNGSLDIVRFGVTVTVRDESGEELRYRIVGVDEVDPDRDCVSWMSPIAKALLNARLGQTVRFKFPAGEKELQIVAIHYE